MKCGGGFPQFQCKTRVACSMVRRTRAICPQVDSIWLICVSGTLVDVHSGPVVNCAVVRMVGRWYA